jgi:cation:H+ antiporter
VGSLASPVLVAIFAGAAIAIWVAGISLSNATDALDARLGLGDALGGLILLGIATSLPEVAITVSAALKNHLDLAIGNLIGGIAIQTVVLALLDARGPPERPLSYLVGSLTLVIEATTVIAVVVIAIAGTQLPESTNVGGVSPASVAILSAWILGLLAVNRMRRRSAWEVRAPGARPGRRKRSEPHPEQPHPFTGKSTLFVTAVFGAAALVTLGSGFALEEAGNALASRAGLTAGIFGATVIAAATALPEVSTGFAAVKLGDYRLAMSDIFGGNGFMPALFLFADLIAGRPTLTQAKAPDLWLAGLGALVTVVYVTGIILRPERTRLRMGFDSRLVILLYMLGVLGLIVVPAGSG